jgi:hypothetical protein
MTIALLGSLAVALWRHGLRRLGEAMSLAELD